MGDEKILAAARWAAKAHEGQKRKNGSPYILHPMRVAGRVAAHPYSTEDMVAAAYLHDVAEDTTTSIEDLERAFGAPVAGLVRWLTKKPYREPSVHFHRVERERLEKEYLETLVKAPWEAKLVKLADRLDNLGDLQGTDPKWRRRYAEKTLLLLDAIGDADKVMAAELRGLATMMASAAWSSPSLKGDSEPKHAPGTIPPCHLPALGPPPTSAMARPRVASDAAGRGLARLWVAAMEHMADEIAQWPQWKRNDFSHLLVFLGDAAAAADERKLSEIKRTLVEFLAPEILGDLIILKKAREDEAGS